MRLRSIDDQGCGSFSRCRDSTFETGLWADRSKNWLAFYCDDDATTDAALSDEARKHAQERRDAVDDCALLHGPAAASAMRPFAPLRLRCFTSFDSAFALNANLVHRTKLLAQTYSDGVSSPVSLRDYAASKWNEPHIAARFSKDHWGALHVPICLSTRGLFQHARGPE